MKPNPKGPPILVYSSVKEGGYFGDVDFLREENAIRVFSVKARTDVELFSLTKQDLTELGREYKKELAMLFSESEDSLQHL